MWLTRIFPIRGGATWLYCVGLFCTSFYGSWLVFGLLYFFIAYFHGDLEAGHLPRDGRDWIPCILEMDGFSSSFLYSLETQHTIGYGGRQPTTQCPDVILTLSVQVKRRKKDVIYKLYNTISLGSPWMSNSSLYGWSCVFQAISTKKQEQDSDIQHTCSHHEEEQEAVSDHQDWRS